MQDGAMANERIPTTNAKKALKYAKKHLAKLTFG